MGLSSSGLNAERVQKVLSAHGVASRREAEKMILDGRVSVNGFHATLGQRVVFGVDDIVVDGIRLATREKPVYIMLNKPRGCLTTVSDDRGRATVMEFVAEASAKVYPVGRLDKNTEGLLLFTNDGHFANAVAHPSFNKDKTYEVNVRGDVYRGIERLRLPMKIDERTIQAVRTELISVRENGGIISITIKEGRNRQVKRMCEACGVNVRALKRVSIGTLSLGTLKTGEWRYLTAEEVSQLG
jgi:23S rRNA pseudouridine2605 synthase